MGTACRFRTRASVGTACRLRLPPGGGRRHKNITVVDVDAAAEVEVDQLADDEAEDHVKANEERDHAEVNEDGGHACFYIFLTLARLIAASKVATIRCLRPNGPNGPKGPKFKVFRILMFRVYAFRFRALRF